VSVYGVKLQRSDDLRLSRHVAGCSEESDADFRSWCQDRRAEGLPLAVDLFSGAGGLSLGLHEAGWAVAMAVDNDEKSLQTHRHNFPGLTVNIDLGDPDLRQSIIRRLRREKIDLIAGGPPCQPFSRAGRSKIRSLVDAGVRDPVDERKNLWRAFLDVAIHVRPRAVLMENVPDMALGDHLYAIRTMVEGLETAGYHTEITLVDAWQYGVPQHRKRLILLARRDSSKFDWPAKGERVTVREAIADLPRLGESTGGRLLTYRKRKLDGDFIRAMRDGADDATLWDHMTRPVRDDDREVFAMMDSHTLYSDIPAELRRYRAETFDDKYKRLGWDELSRSITAHIAKDGYWYIPPEELRTLTVREAARIQTFPDRFRFAGTRSDAFRQIGNAVPPALARAAAHALQQHNEHGSTPRRRQTNPWPAARTALTRWAEKQREGDAWFLFPGTQVNAITAAVVALLATRSTKSSAIANVANRTRGRDAIESGDLISMQLSADTKGAVRALERLRPLLRKRRVWRNLDEVIEVLQMKPAEAETLRLLTGQDVLLSTQAAFRVAARVAGTESDRVNSRTDGRVDLARLVGSGTSASLRMAALRQLGSTCCVAEARCTECPLSKWCSTARGKNDNGKARL
jgi:DNA (cytosine-5)-methyltransferase 1